MFITPDLKKVEVVSHTPSIVAIIEMSVGRIPELRTDIIPPGNFPSDTAEVEGVNKVEVVEFGGSNNRVGVYFHAEDARVLCDPTWGGVDCYLHLGSFLSDPVSE